MEQKKIGTILNAKILTATKNPITHRKTGLDGLVIEFISDETINDGFVVEIPFDQKQKPFTVKEVEITTDNKLLCRATESGYWATKISRHEGFDLRTLIGLNVELVEDADKLKKINEESLWC